MALNPSTLADGLKASPEFPADEAAVIAKWSAAWQAYWEESEATYTTIIVGAEASPAAAVTAFEAALVGISVPGNTAIQAATKIKDACKAFWTAATPNLAYLTTPPPAGPWVLVPPFMLDAGAENAFVAALATVFTNNMLGAVEKDPAMLAIATAIHAAPQVGATFLDTTPPASGGPFTYAVA